MTRPARNGVDVPSVFAVIEGVKGQSGMAQVQLRAGNTWIHGTHNHCAIRVFLGRGQEDISRTEPFTFDVAHPAPTPSSTSPRHRWPASDSAHRLLNGSTPDPGTPGVYAGPDNQGVYAGPDNQGVYAWPRPVPRAACRRAERARL